MAFWDRTKTNRLKIPKTFKNVKDHKGIGDTVTWCGQPFPVVGDFIHNGFGVSAGSVGKVLAINHLPAPNHGYGSFWTGVEIEMLSGEIKTEWIVGSTTIPYSAVQEVKDFYINEENRPKRIKVSW